MEQWKRNASLYLAWALQQALVAESGVLVDFLPADGLIRHFSPEEEALMGQSMERLVEKLLRLRLKTTAVRIQCSSATSPEVIYVAVAHAVRVIMQARRDAHQNAPVPAVAASSRVSSPSGPSPASSQQQQPQPPPPPPPQQQQRAQVSTESPQFSLVLILQDVERAPARTLECVSEMLTHKFLSAPPSTTLLVPGSGVDRIDLPSPFLVIATSTIAPVLSPSTTLANQANEMALPARVLNSMLLRIPIILPREAPVAAPELPPIESKLPLHAVNAVFVSPSITKFLRDLLVALRMHEYVARGPPIGAYDHLLLAVRINASLNRRHFVIPLDVELCAVEVLAHQVLIRTDRLALAEQKHHPLAIARRLVVAVLEDLPVLR